MTTPAAEPTPVPETEMGQTLLAMINGYRITQLISVAAKLGIADRLADGPQRLDDLAAATGTHPPSLYRLLRALASVGLFAEEEESRFRLTPLADFLRTTHPNSLHGWAVFVGDREHWYAWGDLLHSVKTGDPAFAHVWGMQNWEYRARHPEANAVFNAAMISASRLRAAAVLAAYDFSDLGVLVDLGGGHGAFLAAALAAHPALRGVLFDLPHVVAGAPALLAAAGVADRCDIVGGDLFAGVPSIQAGAYLMSKVIHDWGGEPAVVILRNCHRAMPSSSQLLLVETVLPLGDTPHTGKLSDVQMLVMNDGGRERTEAEWQALLEAAGFRLTRILPTRGEVSVIEAIPL